MAGENQTPAGNLLAIRLATEALVATGPGGDAATEAKQDAQITQETATAAVLGTTAGAAVVTDANGTIQQYLRGIVTKLIAQLPAALAANGGMKVEGVAGGVAQPVSGPQTNTEFLAANRCTITKSSVNSADASTTLIAANANRKSLAIVNTDANILYVDTSGGTATNACIPIASGGYLALSGAIPTNAITGIWAADGAGVATIFEGA